MNWINKKILGFFVKTNGIISRQFFEGKGLILMFHRIRPSELMSHFEANKKWEVTPDHLEFIINFFVKKKYNIIASKDIEYYLNSNQRAPFVSFTFDDGYKDNVDFAYPIFKKHKIPFTIFLTTSYLNKSNYPWEFIIENYLLENNKITFSLEGQKHSVFFKKNTEREQAYYYLYNIIKKNNSIHALNSTLSSIFQDYLHTDSYKSIEMIDEELVISLRNDNLLSFGIHTHNHHVLSKLTYHEQVKEITKSKDFLFKLTGRLISELAYPYGGWGDINSDTLNAAKTCNINLCHTTFPGNCFAKTNHLLLPRYCIENKTNEKELNYLINGIRHFSYNGFKKNNVRNYS